MLFTIMCIIFGICFIIIPEKVVNWERYKRKNGNVALNKEERERVIRQTKRQGLMLIMLAALSFVIPFLFFRY